MFKRLIGALALIGMAACATPLTEEEFATARDFAERAAPPVEAPGIMTIKDERPAKTRNSRIIQPGIAGGFSCVVGINQLGDDRFGADRLARLEAAIVAAFPERSRGETLTVRDYAIYRNANEEAVAAAYGAAAGATGLYSLARPVPGQNEEAVWREPRCEAERTWAGWYPAEDLTNNLPPFTAQIDATVFGEDVKVHAGRSPSISDRVIAAGEQERLNPAELDVQSVMTAANRRFVQTLRERLAEEPSSPF